MGRKQLMIRLLALWVVVPILWACHNNDDMTSTFETNDPSNMGIVDFHYLALGDSYTIGESVSYSMNFPSQLKDSLEERLHARIKLDIIAETGWRTDNLLNAVKDGVPKDEYDLVTLLIGVNNQFQGRPFSQYEAEFTELLERAISLAGNNPEQVVVISIPDYGFTPFGQNRDTETISSEIDAYNSFAFTTSLDHKVEFINITDITRQGLNEPILIARDNLHPSSVAYSRFVKRIFPQAFSSLSD